MTHDAPQTAGASSAPVGPGGYGLPPVLYVPLDLAAAGAPVALGGDELDVDVLMLPTRDGGRGLPVYTSMDRLLDQWGPGQPWVVIMTSSLDEIEEQQPFDALLVDVEVPEDLQVG